MTDKLSKSEVEQLLPFYVNGSLDEGEKQSVQAVLDNDVELQQEEVFLRDLQDQVKTQFQEVHSPGELGLKRLQRDMRNNMESTAAKSEGKQTRYWQLSALAACVALVAVLAVDFRTSDEEYQAAGGGSINNADGAVVIVTFSPEASEIEIRQLLVGENLTIVAGPSALGVYRLLPGGDVDHAVEVLGANKDIVESVWRE